MSLLTIGSALVALLVAAEPAPRSGRDVGADHIDVSGYPATQQRSYELFAAACARCHPLARSVNARFSPTDWKRYMKRVIRRPGSDISESQAAQIYDFLKYYSARLGIKD